MPSKNNLLAPGIPELFLFDIMPLNKTKIHTLKKYERLKSRKRIEGLFRQGKKFSFFPFYMYYAIGDEKPYSLQAGFGVSSKTFKKAVDRNRVKRICREGYRTQKAGLMEAVELKQKNLSLFFVYTGKELPELKFVSIKITAILERLINHLNENPSLPA